MSGRVRPIEKFAEAVGKCSVAVRSNLSPYFRWTGTDLFSGCGIWQMHRCRLSVSPSRHVCKRIHEPQRLLFGMSAGCGGYFIAHLQSTDTLTESCEEVVAVAML
jgi:hypothetical protein